LERPSFLAIHSNRIFERYYGNIILKQHGRKEIEFDLQNYSNFFDKDVNLRGIDFKGRNDNDVLVGPLARHKLTNLDKFEKINSFLGGFNKFWEKNLLFSSFLGLIEIYSEVIRCIEYLNDPCFNTKRPLPSFDSIKHLEASSAVEAPRGLLLHHYEVLKMSKIKCLKLFTATEFNLPLINKMITKYARILYEEKGDINLVEKMVQLIIRAFDPCVSCATH
ncbi:MAG: hypothetical protein ACFE9Z_17695, partial [Promethearchaeota archaeon]